MAAQYDVNLEKRALLKCLCGRAFAKINLDYKKRHFGFLFN